MMLSPGAGGAPSPAGRLRLDAATPDFHVERRLGALRAWARSLRRSAPHAVLADADGAWAWDPRDRYAAATRHADVRDWMAAHPATDLRLLLAGDPAFDLEAVRRHAARHDVRVTSVMPWWRHAFGEAMRCVPGLENADTAQVCVVEGAHAAWIVAERGVPSRMRRVALREASVDALRTRIASLDAGSPVDRIVTVVLGQGLIDGDDTRGLDAVVLGRLDGDQPPQWLRP